jgi:hypothetical protein
MGQKRKQAPSAEELYPTISRMLVPEYILENFAIYGAEESPSHWLIELLISQHRTKSSKDMWILMKLSFLNHSESVSEENPLNIYQSFKFRKVLFIGICNDKYKVEELFPSPV